MMNLIHKFKNNPRIKNSLWMLIEKALSLFGLIFVVSAVAKYLGPEVYGYLALAASIFAIVNVIARLGLDQIYFKSISKNKTKKIRLHNNIVNLITIVYVPIAFIVLTFFFFKLDIKYFLFFLATAVATYFTSIDMREVHLNALLLSKINVLANTIGLIFSLFLRFVIVKFNLPIYYFVFPIVLVTLIPYLIRKNIVNRRRIFDNTHFFVKKEFLKYSNYFFLVGVPLVISMLSVNIYLQSANFFLALFDGSASVGIYSIANMLAGAWYFVPTTIVMSFLALIYNAKNEEDYINISGKILRYILLITLLIVSLLFFLSDYLILWLYGEDYKQSIYVFKILLFAYFFSVIGFYFYRLAMKFGGYSFLAKKMTLTCLLNILISYFFIKKYGVIGAAFSALITEFLSNMIFNLYYRDMKMISVFSKAIGWRK